jgi:hypothetical protein
MVTTSCVKEEDTGKKGCAPENIINKLREAEIFLVPGSIIMNRPIEEST